MTTNPNLTKNPLWQGELKTKERVRVFMDNEFDPLLDNHPLQGKYAGRRSISITGGFRLIFERYADGPLNFIAIGTHPREFTFEVEHLYV